MKHIILRSLSVLVLLAAMILSLSGCFGAGESPAPAEQMIAGEPAAPQTEQQPETEAEEKWLQPEPEQADGRAVIFSAGGVTVKAEKPELDGADPSLVLHFENSTGEAVVWTIETLMLDGYEIPLGSECTIPAGENSRYTFPLNSPMVSMLLGSGEHTVSVRSVLTDASGDTLAQADSDAITVRFG